MRQAAGVELPLDMIKLILLKLRDRKCLLRFKLVSKLWNDLISSRRFAAEHHIQHFLDSTGKQNDDSSLLSFLILRTINSDNVDSTNFLTLISFDRTDPKNLLVNKNIYLPYLDCKNENIYSSPLLFEAGFGIYCLFDFYTNRIALWNPFMRELKLLPSSPFYSVIEAKPPEHLEHVYGFGLVEYTHADDTFSYRVGRLIKRLVSNKVYFSIEYFSSITNVWKIFPDCYEVEGYESFKEKSVWYVDGMNLNGRFHWFSWFSAKDPHIIWFDYTTEEIGRIEVPDDLLLKDQGRANNVGCSRITRFDNQFMCLLQYYTVNNEKIYFDVWVMREYGMKNSWTKIHTVGPIPDDMYLLGFSKNASGIFFQDFDKGNRLFLCNCITSGIENLGIGSNELEEMLVVEYTESLMSLSGDPDEARIEP